MQQERRSAHRARLPGASVVYETTSHEPREAELFDIGTGGLFIPSVTPLPRGTRLVMEIRLSRGGPSWGALGRVMLTRARPAEGRPSGMGIRTVDIDHAAVEAIQRATGPAAPAREKTVRGIGTPTPPAVWVAKGRRAGATGGRRARTGTAMAAALFIAAAAAATLGVMQWRPRWATQRPTAAAMAAETASAATAATPAPPAPTEAPPAVSAAVTTTTATATEVVLPPSASASAGKPATHAPAWRGRAPSTKRASPAPGDNPY